MKTEKLNEIEPVHLKLKDGRTVLIRSPEEADAQAVVNEIRNASGQTCFMVPYPEEVTRTVREQAEFMKNMNDDCDEFFILAEYSGRGVCTAALLRLSPREKMRHRACFGISAEEELQINLTKSTQTGLWSCAKIYVTPIQKQRSELTMILCRT